MTVTGLAYLFIKKESHLLYFIYKTYVIGEIENQGN